MSTAVLHGAARAAERAGAHETARTTASAARRGYLVAAAVLAPLCVPAGLGQSAALDFVNLIVLASAMFLLLVPGVRVRVPFLVPVAVIAVGSLMALAQAPSLSLGVLALAQDMYLFAWFVLVVNLLREETDIRALMTAWTATAVAVALCALVQIVLHDGSLAGFLGSRGFRPAGTLYNPNMLADYLVTSLFIAAAALSRRNWWLRALTGSVLLAGLLATKSNGGMAALAAGALVWLVVRAVTRRVPLKAMAAAALLALSLGGMAVWVNGEWGVGDSALASFRQHTFAGRLEHSSESRMRIWDQLQRTYARTPLGIGPGNSGALTLGIADRERPDSWRSKEAHSDYLAYAIERGPLGVLGLLWWTCAGFAAVAAWAHRAGAARREIAGRSATRGNPRAHDPGAWTAAMASLLAASAVHSTVIEKLHFRHFWLVLAMVSASALLPARREQAAAMTVAAPPPAAPAAHSGLVRRAAAAPAEEACV